MGEIFIFVIAFFLIIIVLILFVNIVFSLLEYNFGLYTNKPFFVHFYFSKKKLSPTQLHILKTQFKFYNSLSDEHKKYFEHRTAKFITNYEFIGKEDFSITDEVKVLISATSIMLTFGMREYLYTNINKILVFPNEYYSTINDAYHKGEFNPRLKVIVFSWSDFVSGYNISNDNLNLGIHEFTHVLHFNSLKSAEASAEIFNRMYVKIGKQVNHPPNRDRLISSDYFRVYAYTNQFEFLAVIIEHFFETPLEFKQEFPELYTNVALMLNYKIQ